MNDKGIKTIFYGNSMVGKTAIILRLIDDIFRETTTTIGASFLTLKHNNKKYDVWDTAGQERYHSLSPMYFKGASIEIFVFDVTDQNTLFVLKTYEKYMSDNRDNRIIVVGNKIDKLEGPNELFKIDQSVKYKIGNMGMAHRIYGYVYMSAKTGDGAIELLKMIDQYASFIEHELEELPKIIDFPELSSLNSEPQSYGDECSC